MYHQFSFFFPFSFFSFLFPILFPYFPSFSFFFVSSFLSSLPIGTEATTTADL